MSVRRSLWFLAIAALAAAGLAACGSHPSSPSAALTPGPTPAARPGAFVWVVGYPTLVIGSANGGATWRVRHRHTSGDIVSDSLFAVAFGDASHGWAVRRAGGSLVATVLATSNAGRTWRWQYPAPKGGELLSVAATDATHAWAAGYQGDLHRNGLMIATSDGGKTWTRQRLPASLVALGVAFADARHGWAVVDEADNAFSPNVRSCVLSTTDGGAHWRISYAGGSGGHPQRAHRGRATSLLGGRVRGGSALRACRAHYRRRPPVERAAPDPAPEPQGRLVPRCPKWLGGRLRRHRPRDPQRRRGLVAAALRRALVLRPGVVQRPPARLGAHQRWGPAQHCQWR